MSKTSEPGKTVVMVEWTEEDSDQELFYRWPYVDGQPLPRRGDFLDLERAPQFEVVEEFAGRKVANVNHLRVMLVKWSPGVHGMNVQLICEPACSCCGGHPR